MTKIIISGEKRHLLLEEDLRVEAVGTLERTLRLRPTRAKTGTKMVLIKGCTTCQGLKKKCDTFLIALPQFTFSCPTRLSSKEQRNIAERCATHKYYVYPGHKSKFQLAPDIVRRSEGRSRSVGCSRQPLFHLEDH